MSAKSIPNLKIPPNPLYSEEVFRLLVESVRDYAIFVLDPAGHIATWNIGAQRFKGYAPEEIIGKHFSVFYPEADKQADKPAMELREAKRLGRFEDEGWRIRKDGSRFWANVIITRIDDERGNHIGFGKITRDLTERRRSERAYRLLVESVQDYAIYSLDANGNVTSWNQGAERIKGYTAAEIIGQHFSRFYTPEDRAVGRPEQVLRTARDQGHFEGEAWRMRKDGTRFWSSVVVTPVYDDEGTLIGYSKVTRDMTERKKLMDQIHAHARELELRIAEREQSNAELEAFSYSVSHDLRAPLRAIEGFASALQEDYGENLDEGARDYLQQIMTASTRMNRLVQDLLNYSRLSRVELVPEIVNVRSAVEQAIQELGKIRGGVEMHVPVELNIRGHEATLVQALFNLIGNGLKFHRAGELPQVRVEARKAEDGMVRIEIRDNGIGIEPQHQERIFKVFERLHGADEYAGTGIGLAIVKRGIERAGGRCGVVSEYGKGSTFWIELPIQEKD